MTNRFLIPFYPKSIVCDYESNLARSCPVFVIKFLVKYGELISSILGLINITVTCIVVLVLVSVIPRQWSRISPLLILPTLYGSLFWEKNKIKLLLSEFEFWYILILSFLNNLMIAITLGDERAIIFFTFFIDSFRILSYDAFGPAVRNTNENILSWYIYLIGSILLLIGILLNKIPDIEIVEIEIFNHTFTSLKILVDSTILCAIFSIQKIMNKNNGLDIIKTYAEISESGQLGSDLDDLCRSNWEPFIHTTLIFRLLPYRKTILFPISYSKKLKDRRIPNEDRYSFKFRNSIKKWIALYWFLNYILLFPILTMHISKYYSILTIPTILDQLWGFTRLDFGLMEVLVKSMEVLVLEILAFSLLISSFLTFQDVRVLSVFFLFLSLQGMIFLDAYSKNVRKKSIMISILILIQVIGFLVLIFFGLLSDIHEIDFEIGILKSSVLKGVESPLLAMIPWILKTTVQRYRFPNIFVSIRLPLEEHYAKQEIDLDSLQISSLKSIIRPIRRVYKQI